MCLLQKKYSAKLVHTWRFTQSAVLFACLLSGWAIMTGRLPGHKVGNAIKYLKTQRNATSS